MSEAAVTEEVQKPRRRKSKTPRAPRQVKKREYRVEIAGEQSASNPGYVKWEKAPHGDEVTDTRSGLDWIKANGSPGKQYRVVQVCASVTVKHKTVTVLE